MTAETRHGGATKIRKITKITKKTKAVLFVIFVNFVVFVPPPWRVSVSSQAQQSEQRPPVFRAGAHYVRVDAYPTSKDGRILEGLTRDDFEIYEDGKPQAIENADFITFPTWTPETERRDPRTQEEGYQLAGDASYRVFAVVIDRDAFDMVGWNVMHRPLIDFLERTLGPKDLFGLLHTRNEWRDLVLGQKTATARIDLNKRDWWTTRDDYDDLEWALVSCGLESLVPLSRADRTYSLLEGLVHLLGAIREERKSIVYVADGLPSAGSGGSSGASSMPEPPKIGVTPGGRLGAMPRDAVGGGSSSAYCNEERMRLSVVNFGERFRELLKSARTSNVAFYPISPKGLQGIEFTREGGADLAGFRSAQRRLDSLLSLASETDGVAVVNTNDLHGGLTRIAHDLQAYYVLGYYTTNTTWDGGLRSIKVRLRPKRPSARPGTGDTIRARRQYRAPTQEEIAAISASASPARSSASAAAAPPPAPTMVRKPAAYLLRARAAAQPADVMHLTRTDRIRVEWETVGALDQRTARVLDRTGKPLPIDVPIAEQDGRVVVELPMAAFARGEYALELTVGSGSIVERSPLAFRIQ